MAPTDSFQDKADFPPVSALDAGMKSACPRCGEGRLYDGVLAPAKQCMNCGLDYTFIDSGDGPAVFVILIIGFVVVGLGMVLQSAFNMPFWLLLVLLIPIIVGLSLWGLRFSKAVMIALQYQTAAREGAWDKKGGDDQTPSSGGA